MKIEIDGNLMRVIVLDISGVYIQIEEQGYYDSNRFVDLKEKYTDEKHWHILVL